jgi:tetratricopeptide (TPR) repeat protein
MRAQHGSWVAFGFGLGLMACASSGGASGGGADGDSLPGSRPVRVGDREGGGDGGSAGGDDDFAVKVIEDVKAPVYLDGVKKGAQDAFRKGVAFASSEKPNFKKAIEYFEEAADEDPKFLEAFFNWGQALERLGKSDEALEVYKEALEKNPGSASVEAYIAKVYLGKARSARFVGDDRGAEKWLGQAKSTLDALLATEPSNVAVNNAMAVYYLMENDIEAAERHVREVLYVEPTNVTGLNTRGLINLKQNKFLMAKWIFENKVLREDPASTEAHTNLGYTYIKLEQRPLAMKHFQKALEYDPDNMEVRMNIAAMLLEHLDYEQALGHYELVLRQQPKNAEAKAGKCDAIFGLGGAANDRNAQFKKALSCYDALLAEQPERAHLYKRAAETCQNRLQDLEGAVGYYEKYLKHGKLEAAEADRIGKTIFSLKDIIKNGGLKAMMEPMPEEPMPEEPLPETPAPEGTP